MENVSEETPLDKIVKEEGLDKPPKVRKLEPEESVPTLHPPKPGDPEEAIRELEERAERTPPEPKDDTREIPKAHQVPLEEAVEELEKFDK